MSHKKQNLDQKVIGNLRTANENDQLLWERWLAEQEKRIDFTEDIDELFEFVIAERILRNFDFSLEEIRRGIVDGGQDGGIDALYVIANDVLVEEIDEIPSPGSSPKLQLHVIQSKNQQNFGEAPIEKLSLSMVDVLTLDPTSSEWTGRYNTALVERIKLFHAAYDTFAPRFPTISIEIHYACRGSSPNQSMKAKAQLLEKNCRSRLHDSSVTFNFLGISELLQLARTNHSESAVLKCTEGPLLSDGGGLVALVRIDDYFKFVTDSEGNLRTELFESNVRDYQGSTEINKEIRTSLISPSGANFWWLNNGITVICQRLEANTKNLQLEGAQIVNGLQTSHEVYRALSEKDSKIDERLILVRVIKLDAESIRDEVIKATNSQTSIPASSLRASEKIQRDIEDFFEPRGYYYDRRKNKHKNEGKPATRIVSIPRLAQAYSAIVLGRPDNARARPSSLLKSEERYEQVFSEQTPLEAYLNCVLILDRVDSLLRRSPQLLNPTDRNNAQFHVAMVATQLACNTIHIHPRLVKELDVAHLSDATLQRGLDIWAEEFQAEQQLGSPDDVIAKGPTLVQTLKSRVATEINRSPESNSV